MFPLRGILKLFKFKLWLPAVSIVTLTINKWSAENVEKNTFWTKYLRQHYIPLLTRLVNEN